MTINFPEWLRKILIELRIHLTVIIFAFWLVFFSINEVSLFPVFKTSLIMIF